MDSKLPPSLPQELLFVQEAVARSLESLKSRKAALCLELDSLFTAVDGDAIEKGQAQLPPGELLAREKGTLDVREKRTSSALTDDGDAHHDLFAVFCHSGGPDSGHYWVFLKSNGEWSKYNDSHVHELEQQQNTKKKKKKIILKIFFFFFFFF